MVWTKPDDAFELEMNKVWTKPRHPKAGRKGDWPPDMAALHATGLVFHVNGAAAPDALHYKLVVRL